ncbi:MAG TPA: hypothetical protein VMJ10_23245 [Kofleriaceae bacterium]|nr:hypothetical protein [Kofleriaceae bacterium]
MLTRSARVAIVLAAACGSHPPAEHATTQPAPDKLTLRPALTVGDRFHYHMVATIEATVTAGGTPQHSKATLELDDAVEVTGQSEVKEQLSNPTVNGDGEVADAMQRVAAVLPSAIVTTHFDANWQVASTSIDGTQDDAARTMLMNLTPVVSFRLAPKQPVAVGDTWQNQWGEALHSERGSAAGKVATSVRYTLRDVSACGARRCATIVGDGEDAIPAQDGASGSSHFHGEQRVDLASLVPISKSVESKTILHGEQQGQPFDYANDVTIRIERADN